MGTSYSQYPYETLQTLGTSLGNISDTVQSKSQGSTDVAGLDSDQSRISHALGDFHSTWDASAKKLGENIGETGILSGQIGKLAGDTDAALAAAMRVPGGSGSSGGRRGGSAAAV